MLGKFVDDRLICEVVRIRQCLRIFDLDWPRELAERFLKSGNRDSARNRSSHVILNHSIKPTASFDVGSHFLHLESINFEMVWRTHIEKTLPLVGEINP